MSASNPQSERDLIAILDFGGQYTQLIARRVRECGVYCEIYPFSEPAERLSSRHPKGIILSGGPASVYEPGAPKVDTSIYKLGVPVLGICYGSQLMAHQLGGRVAPAKLREYGRVEAQITNFEGLFSGLKNPFVCWMSHGDVVEEAPAGFLITARTSSTPITAMENRSAGLYGVQFHPEVAHTPHGLHIIRNFLHNICGARSTWNPRSFIESAVEEIRQRVGKSRVICGLSGGVDSSCTAVLVHRAVGDQLTCIFVNHGLLRLGEAEKVRQTFEDNFNIRLVYVDAEERFLSRLRGVTDPEEKRKIIGEEFIRVFEEQASMIKDAKFLAQGTLYPDVIESGVGNAATIKSHHNVGGLPEDMQLEVIEPLRWLFKDEVRAVAAELGLPEDIVWRQPFPGPGLAIRIVGEVNKERLDRLRKADDIVVTEIKRAGWYRRLWMGFAILAPIRSVGVMGDQRTYQDTIVLRAVTSEDGMTADWARLPYDLLERISSRIINEVEGINRVVYDISSKPPATMEWE
ncbi:MAG: glutamine-hydrolyzing GMP synthase [Armatimonadota bacterium]|nr:glutamine-hydrolyzing GMP synthase [Armatimonadota bacterium]